MNLCARKLAWRDTEVLGHQATKNVVNPKMTKWQNLIKFKWYPYFTRRGSKNSSGMGKLLGYEMFQAKQNRVIFSPTFKIFNVFRRPPHLRLEVLALGDHFTYIYRPPMKIVLNLTIKNLLFLRPS